MMKSNLIFEYKKLYMLIKMEVKRIFNHISNVVLLALLIIIFVNMFVFLYNNDNAKLDSKIALAIEDTSIEVNTLIGNIKNNKLKNVLEFVEVSLEEGLELLKENEVVAVISVKSGTADLINNGYKASFDLYINDEANITATFLVEYINSLVEVLNEGQRGAMIYWDIMKANGYNFDERLDELNNIALKYMTNFLTRSSIYEDSIDIDKYNGSIINYYFTTALILFAVIFTILYHLDIVDDFKKGRMLRLSFSNYKWWSVYTAKLLVSTMFITIILMLFEILFMMLFNTLSFFNVLKTGCIIIGINLIIDLIVIVFYIAIKKGYLRNIAMFLFWFCIIYASGIIVPLTSMNSMFRYLSKFNFITIAHKVLLDSNINLPKIITFIIYILFFMLMLYFAQGKRECEE